MVNSRWYPLRKHPEQLRLIHSPARFKIGVAGRRSGKTERAKRYVVRRGLREALAGEYETYTYFLAAPTRDQAKAIYWNDLKRLVPAKLWAGEPSETSLSVRTVLGAEFYVVGMDKPQRIEGRPWNGGVLDEYGNMKPEAWPENVRPALSDRQGWCWFVGVPEGRNHYYDLYREAQRPDAVDWDTFHWPSADILPASEIEAAKRDLDELTFAQEYEASFVNFSGRAYYAFTDGNIQPVHYNPALPLLFGFDFNISPGVAIVLQEQDGITCVVDEMWIDRGSNTERICEMLIAAYSNHKGEVICYGDASGGNQGSAQLSGSDWDIITERLRRVYGPSLFVDVPMANPPERTRLNAVNARICNQDGQRRLKVNPSCINLIRDLEGVACSEDGRLDKKGGTHLTHISDALGYYIELKFPLQAREVHTRKVLGI